MSDTYATVVRERSLYLDRIAPFLGRPVVKVLTGMRRVGKSCLLRMMRDELIRKGMPAKNLRFIDKESLEFDHLRTDSDLHKDVTSTFRRGKGPKVLLVDEVQEIAGWERAIASLAGRGDIDIVLTGSNAHLFSSELATRLVD